MPLVAGIVVLVFGGLTVALDDALFIKLKPTIVNGLFAAVLLGGLAFKRPLLEPLFNTVFQLDRQGWVKLTRRWAVFFALMATANETAWRHLSTDDWVTFKVFGLIPATFAFAAAQVGLLRRHSRLGVEAGQATEPF
jgi:intracellular septation protein